VTIVDESVFVRDVVALFVEKRLRMLVVADASGRAQGVVHESRVVREILDITHAGPHPRCLGWDATTIEPASSVTSTPVTVLESTPLRDALLRMATAHQRQVLVVDEQGFPVGLLLDVDAMHDLRRAETPDDDEP
jgi:CBS domain containing-hemolysin-like protein